MLRVNTFIVNNTRLNNPESSYVNLVLRNIFNHQYDALETRLIKTYSPVGFDDLAYFPHIDTFEKRDGINYYDPKKMIMKHMNRLNISWEQMVSLLIDVILKKKSVNAQEGRDLGQMLKKSSYPNLLTDFSHILGIGYNRGNGFTDCKSTVYNFDSKYAIKQLSSDFVGHKYDMWQVKSNKYKDLKTYYGNVLLESENIQILRNVGKHVPAGTILEKADTLEYYLQKYLPLFSRVPQESYDAIAQDLALLNNKYSKNHRWVSFDFFNPNNIVLRNQKLYLLDDLLEGWRCPNTASDLAYTLLCRLSPFESFQGEYGDALPYARTIFKKVMRAGIMAKLPVVGEYSAKERKLAILLDKLKVNSPANVVIKKLESINSIENTNTRIATLDKYFETLGLTD